MIGTSCEQNTLHFLNNCASLNPSSLFCFALLPLNEQWKKKGGGGGTSYEISDSQMKGPIVSSWNNATSTGFLNGLHWTAVCWFQSRWIAERFFLCLCTCVCVLVPNAVARTCWNIPYQTLRLACCSRAAYPMMRQCRVLHAASFKIYHWLVRIRSSAWRRTPFNTVKLHYNRVHLTRRYSLCAVVRCKCIFVTLVQWQHYSLL